MAHKARTTKSVRRRWVLPSMVGKSGFYWNTSDIQSPYKRLVRVYRKSETNVWVEDQNGCHSTIEGTGYYIGPYHPDSIMAAARKHPEYDMGRFSGRPPFGDGIPNLVAVVRPNAIAHARPYLTRVKPEDVAEIVRQGYQAGENGCDFSLNPYTSDVDQDRGLYHAWFTGWMDAQDAAVDTD